MDDTTDAESSTTWSDYLQYICEARRIPYSVYSSGAMNEKQIENTYLHPQRLVNLMKDPHGSEPVAPLRTLLPTRTSLLPALTTEELYQESPHMYRSMDLSGRFVVIQQLAKSFKVWDLRDPMTARAPRRIGSIAKLKGRVAVVAGVFCRSKPSRPHPTNLQVVVVLFTNPDEDQPNYHGPDECTLQVHTFDIDPVVPERTRTLIRELKLVHDLDLGLPTVDVQGDILVCFYRGIPCRLIVWDYVKKKVELINFSEATALGNELCLRGKDLYLWSHDTGKLWHLVLPLSKNPLYKRSREPNFSVQKVSGVPDDFTSEFHFPDTQPVYYFGVSVTEHSERFQRRPRRTFILYAIARGPTRNHYHEIFRMRLERSPPYQVIFFGNDIVFWRRNELLSPGEDIEYDVMKNFTHAEVDEEGYVDFSPQWHNLSALLLAQPRTTSTSRRKPPTRPDGAIEDQYLQSDLYRIGDLTLQRRGGEVFVYDWPERMAPF